ncbi:MAG: E3 ubiquitin-protein ligase hrd1 [Vezdaea aestivalis]|nr:MAG: E3 ubiquitin-protein ligase hrd1 [Vezdaea aestivalis]
MVVVLRAFEQRANFYSAAVYLAQSNACLMILTNFLLLIASALMLGLQRLLYGPLRPIEVEQLYEKGWFAVTETCLAMTIFREEVGAWFLVMFVCLLAGKVWGWIGEGRIEVLEQQPPANPRLFHLRLSGSLALSLIFDYLLLDYAVRTVLMQARPNMMVMFAFEFAVLSISSTSTTARYALQLYEAALRRHQMKELAQDLREERREELRIQDEANPPDPPRPVPVSVMQIDIDDAELDPIGWQNKPQWLLALDLTTDFCKLSVYFAFFAILFSFYGLPIHILRDVFLTIRSFVKRINDFAKFRKATKEMNERYPDATADELTRDDTCIICRDQMSAWRGNDEANRPQGRGAIRRAADESKRPKKFACGHIFHFSCVRSWLERHHHCPTCRRPIVAPQAIANPTNQQAPRQEGANVPFADRANVPLQNVQPPGGQPQNGRARMFNLGPFRIGIGVGVGAGAGALPQNMEQAQALLGQAHNRPVRPAEGNQGWNQFQDGSQPHAQRGILGDVDAMANIERQMNQLERDIATEFQRLNLSEDYMRFARFLHNELGTLRRRALGNPQQPPGAALPAHYPRHLHEAHLQQQLAHQQLHRQALQQLQFSQNLSPRHHLSHQQTAFSGPTGMPGTLQQFIPQPGQNPLPPGDPNLPAGVVLPEGYTLLPLATQGSLNTTQATMHARNATQIPHRSFSAPRPQTTAGGSTAVSASVGVSQGQPPPSSETARPDASVPMVPSRSARKHDSASANEASSPKVTTVAESESRAAPEKDSSKQMSQTNDSTNPASSLATSSRSKESEKETDAERIKGKVATVEDIPEE